MFFPPVSERHRWAVVGWTCSYSWSLCGNVGNRMGARVVPVAYPSSTRMTVFPMPYDVMWANGLISLVG